MVLLVGCGQLETEEPPLPAKQPPAGRRGATSDAPGPVLRLRFDEASRTRAGSLRFAADGGRAAGVVQTANEGRVRLVDGAWRHGRAVAFPAACTSPRGCPRALVAVAASARLAPGDADFEYGATVMLPADQTTTGSNIVGQGRFASPGGQWKLQVDTLDGLPSCVVRGDAGTRIVRSPVSIADGRWHHLVCRRDDSGISLRVDGRVVFAAGRVGTVASRLPIRIGSPGLDDADDQFHGAVDDVFLRVTARPAPDSAAGST